MIMRRPRVVFGEAITVATRVTSDADPSRIRYRGPQCARCRAEIYLDREASALVWLHLDSGAGHPAEPEVSSR